MLADFTQVRAAPTLNWTEDFAAWLHENDRMPKTIMAYLQDLRHFSRYFEQVNMQPFTPDQLNATDVKAYFKAQDADKSVAPNSRNRRLASLRVLIEWAVAMGILEYDPTVCVKRVAVELSPRDRSKAEMQALESVASTGSHLKRQTEKHTLLGLRDQIVWDLFRDAGLRIHELAGLDVDDLDLEACEIHVMGKGAKKAKVIIPSTLVKALASWVDRKPISAEGALITDWNGKRISTSQIRRRLYLIGQAAGVDVKPHDLRHTYVYSLLDAMLAQGKHMPVALDAARKQARHGDVKTTMLYLRSRDSQIRAAVEAM
jgi:integrase/recombinase XerC